MAVYDLNRAQLQSLVTDALGSTTGSGAGAALWSLLSKAGDLPAANAPANNKLKLEVIVSNGLDPLQNDGSDSLGLPGNAGFFVQDWNYAQGSAKPGSPHATESVTVASDGAGWLFAGNDARVALTDSNVSGIGDTIYAGTGADSIAIASAAPENSAIVAAAKVYGGTGADTLRGGAGADSLYSGSLKSTYKAATKTTKASGSIYAGTQIYGGGHSDMFGGAGVDSLYGYDGPGTDLGETLNAGSGAQVLEVFYGDNKIVGSSVATATATIATGSGSDSVALNAGAYTVDAGSGATSISGGAAASTATIVGSTSASANLIVTGGAGKETVSLNAGHYTFNASTARGAPTTEKWSLVGGGFSDTVALAGKSGQSATLTGGTGAQTIGLSGNGAYSLKGGPGALTITDSMTGGSATVNLGTGGGLIGVDTLVTGSHTTTSKTTDGATEYTYKFHNGAVLVTNASSSQITFTGASTIPGSHG